MKKILVGIAIAAAAYYYLNPAEGPQRRRRLSHLWASRKDTVLEATRATSGVVAGVSQNVGDAVGGKIADLRADPEGTNGKPLTAAASTKPPKS